MEGKKEFPEVRIRCYLQFVLNFLEACRTDCRIVYPYPVLREILTGNTVAILDDQTTAQILWQEILANCFQRAVNRHDDNILEYAGIIMPVNKAIFGGLTNQT